MWNNVKLLNLVSTYLVHGIAIALTATSAYWVTKQPLFNFKTVEIQAAGNQELRHVNGAIIRNTTVPKIEGNFFSADLAEVKTAFESVPWVRSARVQRQWPDKLVVQIEEHQALGTWNNDGQLLSVLGEVFTANLAEAEEDGAVLALTGPKGSHQQVMARYLEFKEWLAPLGAPPVEVRLSHTQAWTVVLSDGTQIELGRESGTYTIKNRVAAILDVHPRLAERLQHKITKIDARYGNGIAIQAPGVQLKTENLLKKRS